MPMYVVRAKMKQAEQQRLAQFIEKQKGKGKRVDRIINNIEAGYNSRSPSKIYIYENGENIASSRTKKKNNSIYPEGYLSATGKQKIRGKSKPPRI